MYHENVILRAYKLQEINILSMCAMKIAYSIYKFRENLIFGLEEWKKSDLVYLLSRKSDMLIHVS